MTTPANFAELTKSDPVMAALRVLRDQRRSGQLTAEAYHAAFAELECGEGQPCDACLIRVAYVVRGERKLCASCALKEHADAAT